MINRLRVFDFFLSLRLSFLLVGAGRMPRRCAATAGSKKKQSHKKGLASQSIPWFTFVKINLFHQQSSNKNNRCRVAKSVDDFHTKLLPVAGSKKNLVKIVHMLQFILLNVWCRPARFYNFRLPPFSGRLFSRACLEIFHVFISCLTFFASSTSW